QYRRAVTSQAPRQPGGAGLERGGDRPVPFVLLPTQATLAVTSGCLALIGARGRLTGVNAMEEMFSRGWDDLIARDSGPMHFRVGLQPIVATALAIRAGWRDAGERQPPFFWALIRETKHRRSLLRQMWKDVGRLFLLAVVLDVIYQVIILHGFYPV